MTSKSKRRAVQGTVYERLLEAAAEAQLRQLGQARPFGITPVLRAALEEAGRVALGEREKVMALDPTWTRTETIALDVLSALLLGLRDGDLDTLSPPKGVSLHGEARRFMKRKRGSLPGVAETPTAFLRAVVEKIGPIDDDNIGAAAHAMLKFVFARAMNYGLPKPARNHRAAWRLLAPMIDERRERASGRDKDRRPKPHRVLRDVLASLYSATVAEDLVRGV